MKSLRLGLCAAAVILAVANASLNAEEEPSQGIGCAWAPGFSLADLSGPVWAMTVWDDGSGEALYVGGTFATAGGITVNKIARWEGQAWSALSAPGGPGVPPYVSDVQTMVMWDDGGGEALFVGGTYPGSLAGSGVVKWDGASWSPLDGGVTNPLGGGGYVSTLAVFQPESGQPRLYVGGYFVYAGGGSITVNHVASWDGVS